MIERQHWFDEQSNAVLYLCLVAAPQNAAPAGRCCCDTLRYRPVVSLPCAAAVTAVQCHANCVIGPCGPAIESKEIQHVVSLWALLLSKTAMPPFVAIVGCRGPKMKLGSPAFGPV